LVEGFEVGLNARAAAGVGAGDGEGDRDHPPQRNAESAGICPKNAPDRRGICGS
jgi:hypothetical protein